MERVPRPSGAFSAPHRTGARLPTPPVRALLHDINNERSTRARWTISHSPSAVRPALYRRHPCRAIRRCGHRENRIATVPSDFVRLRESYCRVDLILLHQRATTAETQEVTDHANFVAPDRSRGISWATAGGRWPGVRACMLTGARRATARRPAS